VFDWDENNLKKIMAHRVTAAELEQALAREPVLICEQEAMARPDTCITEKTDRNRLLRSPLTERNEKIRVITAYTLDTGQKCGYMSSRARGE
jgi:hypothetical protein